MPASCEIEEMFAKLKQKTIEERPKAQSPKPTPPEADGKAKVNVGWALIRVPNMPSYSMGLCRKKHVLK